MTNKIELSKDLDRKNKKIFSMNFQKLKKSKGEIGRYIIAWLLGVPFCLLLLIWLFKH